MSKRAAIAASIRYVIAALALVAFVWLLRFDALNTFPETLHQGSFLVQLAEFGFSALTAFLFLAVGVLGLLYVRQRRIGFLLFALSCAMMVTFSVETAALLNGPVPSLLTEIASTLAIYLLALLFLVFPHNYFTRQPQSARAPGCAGRWGACAYFVLLTALLTISLVNDPLLDSFITYGRALPPPSTVPPTSTLLILLGLLGCFGCLLMAYLRPSSARERQQARILAVGMLLGCVPFLTLTLLPTLVTTQASSPYIVPGEISTVSMVLIPVAIAYAILRYHMLIVDRYIRPAVTLLVGGIFLAVAAYLAFFTSSVLLPGDWAQVKWCIAALFLLLVPAAWHVAPRVTSRIFAPDLASTHHLLYGQHVSADGLHADDSALEAVVRQLMQAARAIFSTQRLWFFAYHQESGTYHPVVPRGGEAGDDISTHLHLAVPGEENRTHQHWLDADHPLFKRLALARRPLYLSEALFQPRARSKLLPPRLLVTPAMQEDPLFVQVMARGKPGGNELLGVLVLGSRDDSLPYAGPDFVLIQLLLLRFSWMLGKALAEAQSQEHLTMLKALYSATSTALPPTPLAEDIARAYASAAARATNAGAEVWLSGSQAPVLQRVAQAGEGPHLPYGELLRPLAASDWLSWFYEGPAELWRTSPERTRPLVLEPPTFPFAWLPLVRGDQLLGVLVLTYRPPHRHFSPAERQVLEIFAHQLAVALENARVASALRAATSAQHEQDRLKSQAIAARLQDLLQPLATLERSTAILRQFNLSPPPGAHTATPPLQVELPREPAPTPFPLLEGLDELGASIGASLTRLRDLARAPLEDTPHVTSLGTLFRRQVNAILRGFGDEEGDPLVLVIAPDPDFRALLRTTLDLGGYTCADVATGELAVEWVKQNRARGKGPAALLLHLAALGGRPLDELTRELQRALGPKAPFPPLLLIGGKGSPDEQGRPSFIPIDLPFSVHALAEHLRTCLPRRAADDD